MDQSANGAAHSHEDTDALEHVAPELASDGVVLQVEQVSRRGAIASGARLLAATAAVAGVANVSEASASTSDAKGKPGKKALKIEVNGQLRDVTYSPDTMLLYVLRDEFYLRGPKFGCGLKECGACAVLLDGQQIRSCITPVSAVGSKEVVTLDGLAETWHGKDGKKKYKKGDLHPLQQAWIDEQVPQCGYCQGGMIIQAASLLAENPHPTLAEIKTNMNGHLCRCGTYNAIFRAVQRAAKEMAK
jgi:isoquinoline 1-oxidoreductase subunit alpha